MKAAKDLGRLGGKATAKNRTPKERSEAARKAARARWAKLEEERRREEEKKNV